MTVFVAKITKDGRKGNCHYQKTNSIEAVLNVMLEICMIINTLTLKEGYRVINVDIL